MKENFGNIDKSRSKPLKFGYNHYTGEWKDWSKNPLKKKNSIRWNPNSVFYSFYYSKTAFKFYLKAVCYCLIADYVYLKNFHFGIMASIPNPVNRKRLVTSVYKKVDR